MPRAPARVWPGGGRAASGLLRARMFAGRARTPRCRATFHLRADSCARRRGRARRPSAPLGYEALEVSARCSGATSSSRRQDPRRVVLQVIQTGSCQPEPDCMRRPVARDGLTTSAVRRARQATGERRLSRPNADRVAKGRARRVAERVVVRSAARSRVGLSALAHAVWLLADRVHRGDQCISWFRAGSRRPVLRRRMQEIRPGA